ncbi:UDP-N-acetylglucosamine 4-epimerase [subsurface metagenome]
MLIEIKNSTILVTGGAGFIGSHLADELLSKNYNVKVLDNLSNGSLTNLKDAVKSNNFTFIEGDILDKSLCVKSLKGIDIVFHLACLGVRHSLHHPFENQRVNAEGTYNILQAALDNKIKKFFYVSSSEVYGKVKTFPITEEAIPEPTTIYAASKLAGEVYSKAFYESFGLDVTILRLFNNYGPRAHYEGDAGELIPRTIVYALNDKQPIIFGDGENARDFIYVKDL